MSETTIRTADPILEDARTRLRVIMDSPNSDVFDLYLQQVAQAGLLALESFPSYPEAQELAQMTVQQIEDVGDLLRNVGRFDEELENDLAEFFGAIGQIQEGVPNVSDDTVATKLSALGENIQEVSSRIAWRIILMDDLDLASAPDKKVTGPASASMSTTLAENDSFKSDTLDTTPNSRNSIPSSQFVTTADEESLFLYLDGHRITRHSFNPWNTSGAYCDVFRGSHPTFGNVVLKRPRMSGSTCTESQLRNFKQEARVWKELHHPNILQFVGMIDTGAVIWLISIFAENGTLLQYIIRNPEVDRHDLVHQFSSGLTYLHSNGVVHGDLKSPNLLISAGRTLLIGDFGLSKLGGMVTATSKQGVGSAPWMAPELFDENPTKTLSSDVYAFGIIISEVLREELPFQDYLNNDMALIDAILENIRPPTEPRESLQGKPYNILWDVAEECWDPEPSRRPSIADIYDRLRLNQMRATSDIIPSRTVRNDETTAVRSGLSELATDHSEAVFNSQSALSATRSSDVGDNRLCKAAPDKGDSAAPYASPPSATFVEIDLDKVRSVSQSYEVSATPAPQNREETGLLHEADLKGLVDMMVAMALKAGSLANSSSAAVITAGDASLLEYLDMGGVDCLNEAEDHTLASIVKEGTRNRTEAYLQSHVDEQLLIRLTFTEVVKIRAIALRTKDLKSGPKKIKIDINRPVLGFDDVKNATGLEVIQVLELSEDLVKEGKPIRLLFTQMQRVISLHIYVASNHGNEEVTRIDAIDVYGQPVAPARISSKGIFEQTHEQGMNLFTLFQHEGGSLHLSTSVSLLSESIYLCPDDPQKRRMAFGSLASAVWIQYLQTQADTDLTKAIALANEVLKLHPPDHPGRVTSLNNLAATLMTRYQGKGSRPDLAEAIKHYREALQLCPPGHSDRAATLNNLSNALTLRHDHEGNLLDLEEATKYSREALNH